MRHGSPSRVHWRNPWRGCRAARNTEALLRRQALPQARATMQSLLAGYGQGKGDLAAPIAAEHRAARCRASAAQSRTRPADRAGGDRASYRRRAMTRARLFLALPLLAGRLERAARPRRAPAALLPGSKRRALLCGRAQNRRRTAATMCPCSKTRRHGNARGNAAPACRTPHPLLPQSRWACRTPRRCRKKIPWAWITCPSMPTRPAMRAARCASAPAACRRSACAPRRWRCALPSPAPCARPARCSSMSGAWRP